MTKSRALKTSAALIALATLGVISCAKTRTQPAQPVSPSSPGPGTSEGGADTYPENPAFAYTGATRDANIDEVVSNGQGGYKLAGQPRLLRARFVDLVKDGAYTRTEGDWKAVLGDNVATAEMSRKVRDRYVYFYADILDNPHLNAASRFEVHSSGDGVGPYAFAVTGGEGTWSGEGQIQDLAANGRSASAWINRVEENPNTSRLVFAQDLIAQVIWNEQRRSVAAFTLRSNAVDLSVDECSDGPNGEKSPKLAALFERLRNSGGTSTLSTWAAIGGASKLHLDLANGTNTVRISGSLTDRPNWPVHIVVEENGAPRNLENASSGFQNNDAAYAQINMFRLNLSSDQGKMRIRMDMPGCTEPAYLNIKPLYLGGR